jgi:hypothetical protein
MPTAEQRAKQRAEHAAATDGASSPHAFDADKRAREREAAAITVGGQTFHRRKKDWDVTRGLRRAMREQERSQTEQARLRKQLEDSELTPEAVEALQDKLDDLGDEADEGAYSIIALLLRDDQDASPPIEFLKRGLDVEDAGSLASVLAGGGEPDPTQTTETSPTS